MIGENNNPGTYTVPETPPASSSPTMEWLAKMTTSPWYSRKPLLKNKTHLQEQGKVEWKPANPNRRYTGTNIEPRHSNQLF